MLQCHICKSNNVKEFLSFPNLGRATSDDRPWAKGGRLAICSDCNTVQKIVDAKWREEIKEVYDTYSLYFLGDGKEPKIFNNVTAQYCTRSDAILNFLLDNVVGKDFGSIIDIGCGVGNTLKALNKTFAESKLYGLEPNPHQKQVLESLPKVEQIYVDMQQIPKESVELITSVHVLEHVDSPVDFLRQLASLLKKDGILTIGVPNYITNPFDLIITDHCSHFAPDTLRALLQSAGFEIIALSDTVINKELVAVCKLAEAAPVVREILTTYNESLVNQQLNWLANVSATAQKAAQNCRPFGIFGTGVAANWLYGQMQDKIDYFVDEDPDRNNKLFHERPVYNSSSIPEHSHLYICLQPNVVDKISDRIQSDKFSILQTPDY